MENEPTLNSQNKALLVDEPTLAYVAGLFDAELALHIGESGGHYYLSIDWLKINKDILTYVARIFGGTVRKGKMQPGQRYQVWNWGLSSDNAYQTLFELWPYFEIKRIPVSICIEFHNKYRNALTFNDKKSIGAKYQAKLQEYQRKPGSGPKSAESIKLLREQLEKKAAFSETSNVMHTALSDLDLPVKEVAYIAGLLDADSSFLINKISGRPSYLLEVKYRKYDRDILEHLANIFGGRVRRALLSTKNKIQPWLWQVTSVNAYGLIKYIYPYLRVKKRNAEICMEFFEKYWTGNYGKPITPERQEIAEKYKALLKFHLTKSTPHKKSEANMVAIR